MGHRAQITNIVRSVIGLWWTFQNHPLRKAMKWSNTSALDHRKCPDFIGTFCWCINSRMVKSITKKLIPQTGNYFPSRTKSDIETLRLHFCLSIHAQYFSGVWIIGPWLSFRNSQKSTSWAIQSSEIFINLNMMNIQMFFLLRSEWVN